jgi:hypothetical protein
LAIASTLPLLHFHFKCFLFASSSSQAKEKKNIKEKKNHREEKLCRKGKELTSSSHFALSLLATASTLPLLHFCFKCFLLASSCSKAKEEKKKHKEKKNHIEEKLCSERREFTFKLLFYPLTFGSHFCLLAFALLF